MVERTTCPYCGEEIAATAKKCKHCGEWIESSDKKNDSSSKSYSERSKELYERWLDFSGVSDLTDMRCMSINLCVFFMIFIAAGAIWQAVTGDDDAFFDYLSGNPFMFIIMAGLLLRCAVIPWISCACRYFLVGTYREVKDEMEREQNSERQTNDK